VSFRAALTVRRPDFLHCFSIEDRDFPAGVAEDFDAPP
jgi:hypothetical protein